MAKIITSSYLNKKLSSDQLRNKVGNVQINSDNFSKSLSGPSLKRFITTKLGGKTETQIEKILRDKYGVSGYQVKKRGAIMGLIKGSEKHSLTEEQIKRNLDRTREERLDRPWTITRGATYSKQYAGGSEVKSHGVMGNIGIDIEKRGGKIGFAANYKKTSSDNSAPKTPSAGIRPPGL